MVPRSSKGCPQVDRHALVREHLPAIRRLARRIGHGQQSVEVEDLVGHGVVGLLEAADRHDPARGPLAFPFLRVRGAMVDGLRTCGLYSRAEVARFRQTGDEGMIVRNRSGRLPDATDPRPNPEQRLSVAQQIARLSAALATLPPAERDLVVGKWLRDLTLREVAPGRSKSWSSRLRNRGLTRLRAALVAA